MVAASRSWIPPTWRLYNQFHANTHGVPTCPNAKMHTHASAHQIRCTKCTRFADCTTAATCEGMPAELGHQDHEQSVLQPGIGTIRQDHANTGQSPQRSLRHSRTCFYRLAIRSQAQRLAGELLVHAQSPHQLSDRSLVSSI